MLMQCCHPNKRPDLLFWTTFLAVIGLYVAWLTGVNQGWLGVITEAVYQFVNVIWWGVLIGIISISILGKVPRHLVVGLVSGRKKGLIGLLRAVLGGVLLDLCSHGVLMIGAKLYERGLSTGQVVAFLVASPWNSLSLTVVLIGLLGIGWTLLFILLSMLIAIITGSIFQWLEQRGVLQKNKHELELNEEFNFWKEFIHWWQGLQWSLRGTAKMFQDGLDESKMVLKWILLGVLIAALLRVLMDETSMAVYFGPNFVGLGLTLLMAIILEVCSEGTAPVAGDLLVRAGAPGNSFAFLMTGVATDYTEIMVMRNMTGSWKVALMLPIVTLPQIIVLGWLINSLNG